ncbi:CobD/CbiB family cobalamin biosynthesis protein [Halorubrum alkaliphilum]|uniref:CobD/CbiB family cobalamin biosynthesis protein n=1 Tax=Halorubrum alkaliphilum TaxID=261290 RepID=UPI001AE5D857|nr:CobD/CbiB family cobalamin biosynthesis protein [Halorubrum alkaliphilum]
MTPAVPLSVVTPAVPLLVALGVAVAVDTAVGEPPTRFHPVAWFGSVVGRVDREWSRPRVVGAAVAIGLPLAAAVAAGVAVATTATVAAAVVGGGADRLLGTGGAGWLPASVVAGVILSVTVSLRMLLAVTAEVVASTESDPETARESIRALVGRETADLPPSALRSAAVESAAENLADGFVAPLVGFVAGAAIGTALVFGAGESVAMGGSGAAVGVALPLSVGVAGAVWVKAVNTLDSMLGYRSKPVGGASARLDDAVMYVPARLTAACLALAAGPTGSVGTLRLASRWVREPSSPNSGWPMATAAVALGVRLEKPGRYVLNPAAEPPTEAGGERAVRLVRLAGGVAVAVAAVTLVAAVAAVALVAAVAELVAASVVAGWTVGSAASLLLARSTPGVFEQ